jgi:hypothetical protein
MNPASSSQIARSGPIPKTFTVPLLFSAKPLNRIVKPALRRLEGPLHGDPGLFVLFSAAGVVTHDDLVAWNGQFDSNVKAPAMTMMQMLQLQHDPGTK